VKQPITLDPGGVAGVCRQGQSARACLYETVDLPEALRDLPSYDFRSGFKKSVDRAFKRRNVINQLGVVEALHTYGPASYLSCEFTNNIINTACCEGRSGEPSDL
jgi:hypothetical protein